MKNIKIKISCPEHSEFVQKRLFDMGYSWFSGAGHLKHLEAHSIGLECIDINCGEMRIVQLGRRLFDSAPHEDLTNHPDWRWPRPENCDCGSTMTDCGVDAVCEKGFDCPVHIENMQELMKRKDSGKFISQEEFREKLEEPFDVGKYYRARDGKKAVYIGKNPIDNDSPYVFGHPDQLIDVNNDGRHLSGFVCDYPSDYDIIGEWKEPVKCWVLYLGGKSNFQIVEIKEHAKHWEEQGYQVKEVTFDE